MARLPALGENEIQQAIKMYHGGASVEACANRFYVSKKVMYKYIKQAGVVLDSKLSRNKKMLRLFEMWQADEPMDKILYELQYSSRESLSRIVCYYRGQGVPFKIRKRKKDKEYG